MSGIASTIYSGFLNAVIPLLPQSVEEIVLFVVTVVLIVVIIDLFTYSNTQRNIRNGSRCYIERTAKAKTS
jgi:ATP/ADP translocase